MSDPALQFMKDVTTTGIQLDSDDDEEDLFTDGDEDKKPMLGAVGDKGGARSFSQTQVSDWNLTFTTGSAEEGLLHKLTKRECIRFIQKEGSSKCHCGRERDEHPSLTEEVDGTASWQEKTSIIPMKTDAVGKFEFKDDSMQSWFFRLDLSTIEEEILAILNLSHYTLYIHFLDFEEDDSVMDETVQQKVEKGLETSLRTLAQKTKLMISSTGLKTGPSRHVHNVLSKLALDPDQSFHTEVFRLACLPWGCLSREQRRLLMNEEIMHVIRPGTRHQTPDESSPLFREKLSPLFSHYLMFDDGYIYGSENDMNFKHFGCFRKRIEKKIAALCETAVNVYVLINGGPEVLNHIIKAIKRGLPVIIIKKTGGFADILAKNYLRATRSVEKYMVSSTKFAVRSKLTLAKDLEDVEDEYEDKVWRILENNHLLTVYDPMFPSQGLDMVICQALLKGQQEDKLNHLLQVFLKKCLDKQKTDSATLQDCFLGSENLQMDLLIEAMLNNSADIVERILEGNLNLCRQFNMDRLSQLYNREWSLESCLPLLITANRKNAEKYGVCTEVFGPLDVRRVLRRLLRASYPLCCEEGLCQCLLKKEHVIELSYEPHMFQTCLPPIQEMFLWALLTNHQALARVFWKYSQDKLASALLAEVLLSRLAEKQDNTDRQFKLRENAKEFGDLAVDVLRVCYELNEELTHVLLKKKSNWWGNQSVMELAYSFRSRKFLSQSACKSLLDIIWKGKLTTEEPLLTVQILAATVPGVLLVPILDVGAEDAQGFSNQESKSKKCCGSCCPKLRNFYSAPIVKYYMNVFLFLVFLGLFSYVLLVDLQPRFTVLQGVLCVWVATYLGEEIRQIKSIKGRTTLVERWKSYWEEGWNKLDVCVILLFTLGMVLGVTQLDPVYQCRRIVLSIDFILFSMRLLQAFAVGQEIGPMLTMILSMFRDTVTFVIILFVFILSYAVASESILFPEARIDPHMLYTVPRKAYWQIYGDFFLDELEGKDAECTHNPALYENSTIERCPSRVGQVAVPILLAVYCIITHVLLLNLLIAKFNDTYSRVQGEAHIHWAWYRCQIFHEFAHRPSLPPPLNAFSCLWWVLKKIFLFIKKIVCCHYCSPKCRNRLSVPAPCSGMLLRSLKNRQVTAQNVRSTTALISWEDPDDVYVTRHRIYCYIVNSSNIIPDQGKPNMVVTVYEMESYLVKHLKPGSSYRIRIKYEADNRWSDLGETDLNTKIKDPDEAGEHESRCVEERAAVLEEDPVVARLDQVYKTVTTNKKGLTTSFQQVFGDIKQLNQKVQVLNKRSLDEVSVREDLVSSQQAVLQSLKSEHAAERTQMELKLQKLQEQMQNQSAILDKILVAVNKPGKDKMVE